MTLLPVIERELRVRARSRATYWTRFAAALLGTLICLPPLMLSGPFSSSAVTGRSVFNGVWGAAFILCCFACLFTADVISAERREGTLGLLFLTRVRTLDVLLGKLGSIGVTSLGATLAFLPVLIVPVLAGGVTGPEAFRRGLVLIDTLFLALAAGLWASAGGWEWFKSAGNASLVVAICVLGPGVFKLLGGSGVISTRIVWLSPLGTNSLASDAAFRTSAAFYWISLGLVHVLGWLLLVGAGLRLRDRLRTERTADIVAAPVTTDNIQRQKRRFQRVTISGDAGPINWLVRRQRGIKAIVWVAAFFVATQYMIRGTPLRFFGPRAYSTFVPLWLAISVLQGCLFAWAASRFFVEARRTGELELLWTTPLGANQIVSAQWETLRRLLRGPMVLMVAPLILQAGFLMISESGPVSAWKVQYLISLVFSIANLFFGVGALCWVGLRFGLTARGQAGAVVRTVTLAKGPPYVLSMLWPMILAPLLGPSVVLSSPGYWLMISYVPQLATLLFYLWLIRSAKRRLMQALRGVEPMRFDIRKSILSATLQTAAADRKARHWTPS